MRPPLHETKRGNPALLASLVVASLLLTTIFFREGPSGPLHRIRAAAITVSKPFAAVGEAVTYPFRSAGGYVSGMFARRTDVETLREQNLELRQRLAQLEEERQEAERVEALARFSKTRKLEGVGARVIGRPNSSWEGAVLLDRGTDDGVKVGMPVIAAGGLLGQIVEADAGSAKARLITDRNSGVAALVQRTRAAGIVRGSIEGELTLDFVEKKSLPKRGDVVITSGMGGVYPKGLVIGDVVRVQAARADLYPDIGVRSRVAVTTIEEVMVLTETPPVPDLEAGE